MKRVEGKKRKHYKFKFNKIWNENPTHHSDLKKEMKEEEGMKLEDTHFIYIFFIQEVPLSRICLILLAAIAAAAACLPPNSFLS